MASNNNKKPPGEIVDDLDLWTRLKQTITPLDPNRPDDLVVNSPVTKPKSPPWKDKPQAPAKPAATVPVKRAESKTPPKRDLTGLDRRTSQRLARGQIEAEARIDLHGESVETARVRLRQFLHQSRARGHRTVLVITGKGSSDFARHTLHGSSHFHAPERQGRLRRMATQWFHDAEFTDVISGYQPAHPKHGGGGAFYVRLRRK